MSSASTSAPAPSVKVGHFSDEDIASEACMQAQKAVLDQLKSPASAKFPDCTFKRNEYEIRLSEDRKTVFVFGHVDSQNSFSAMMRMNFAVKLNNNNGKLEPFGVAVE